MPKLKDSELGFSRRFETVQTDTRLRDAMKEVIPDPNLNRRLALSDPKEVLYGNWLIMSSGREITCMDRLFSPDFDIDSTAELEEISLEGIAQLPVIISNQTKGIDSRENITNFLHALADLRRSKS